MAPFSPSPRTHSRGKNCGGTPKIQVCVLLPLNCPWTRPTTPIGLAWVLLLKLAGNAGWCKRSLVAAQFGGGQIKQSRPGTERPFPALVLFFARLLASSLASQRSFHTLLLAGLQVEGVTLNLLDDVFLLHLALKATKSVLEGLTLLKPNFCQTYTPPDSSGWTL